MYFSWRIVSKHDWTFSCYLIIECRFSDFRLRTAGYLFPRGYDIRFLLICTRCIRFRCPCSDAPTPGPAFTCMPMTWPCGPSARTSTKLSSGFGPSWTMRLSDGVSGGGSRSTCTWRSSGSYATGPYEQVWTTTTEILRVIQTGPPPLVPCWLQDLLLGSSIDLRIWTWVYRSVLQLGRNLSL